jgi:hypothetical protein
LWKCINGRKLEQLHDNQSWMNYLHKIETFMSKLCFKISTHQIYNSWNTKRCYTIEFANNIESLLKELNNERCNEIKTWKTKMETQEHRHKIMVFQNVNPSGRKILCWNAWGHGMACCLHAFHEDGDRMAGYEFNITW